jgi:hypothetical protein
MMLAYLRGRASDRKFRLFAVACCRRAWDLLREAGGRGAVEVAERYADGLASDAELGAAEEFAGTGVKAAMDAYEINSDDTADLAVVRAHHAALYAAYNAPPARTTLAATSGEYLLRGGAYAAAVLAAGNSVGAVRLGRQVPDQESQSRLLRCIFGDPFKPISIAPAVLASQGGTVVRLATAIYEDRRWEDMPLLGDALEEAGVTDQAVLDHCRVSGPHARGCFVVDAILERS